MYIFLCKSKVTSETTTTITTKRRSVKFNANSAMRKQKKMDVRKYNKVVEQVRQMYPRYKDVTVGREKSSIKWFYILRYSNRCWLCGKTFDKKELTLHHVIPYSVSGHTHLKESSILCEHCHFDIVNDIKYDTKEYWDVMEQMLDNVNQWENEIRNGSTENDEEDE